MEAKSDKATPKKFSFRKRRSSKGKKENDVPPVDLGPEQEATELVSEQTRESKPSVSVALEQTPADDHKATLSCSEDSTPKSDESPHGEAPKKKKSKRRSWFKGSSKKSSEKVEDGSELEVKENTEQKGETAAGEGIEVVETDVKSSGEQVVCEVTDHSDGEGYLSVGEASEAEGKGSSPEPVTADDTKRKGFFKRGLSLKRRKSKKQTSEAKDLETNEAKLQTESTEQNSEVDEENETEATEEQSEDIEQSKAEEETTIVKKSPVKPPRKVSFLGPDGKKLESSDDGDSLTEYLKETGDESDEETVTAEDGPSEDETVTAEDGPSKDDTVTAEDDPNGDVSKFVVVMSEDAGCSEALTDGDDDDLTEVSSMSSSLLALSSDAPDTISTSDVSRLFVFTDTDDTGSRITLTGISEESEAESKPEIDEDVPKPEEVSEESGMESKPEVSNGFESRPEATETEPESEAIKLLDNGEKGKASEWELVDRSYDMSVELQRVRKQTLFSVKRLCCTVM